MGSVKLLAFVSGFVLCGVAVAQAPLGGFYYINPYVSQGDLVFPTGAVPGSSPATRFIADDFDLAGFEGQQLLAIGTSYVNETSSGTVQRTISLFEEAPLPNPISGVGNPGNLILSRTDTSTLTSPAGSSVGSGGGLWFPQNVTLPSGKVWVGLSFASQDPGFLNLIGIRAVRRIAGPSSNVAFISDQPGAPGNNPVGQQIELGQTYGGEDLAFTLAVAGQRVRVTINYERIYFTRRVTLTAVTNGRVLGQAETSLFSSVQTRTGTISVPAVTPFDPDGTVSIYVDGGPYLRSRVDFQLPNPPVLPEATIDVGDTFLRNGDCDESGEVDAADLDFVIEQFGTWVYQTSAANADLDHDLAVDAADIDIVISNFGEVDDP